MKRVVIPIAALMCGALISTQVAAQTEEISLHTRLAPLEESAMSVEHRIALAKIDVAAKTIAVTTVPNVPNTPPATNGPTTTFTFQRPDPEHLILEGSLDGRRLRMEARLFDRNNFLLVTRGFNWIQERPFNR